jgi:hypothetical protein
MLDVHPETVRRLSQRQIGAVGVPERMSESFDMKHRVALLALIGIVGVLTVALRGCQDPTKPIPWVSGEHASVPAMP